MKNVRSVNVRSGLSLPVGEDSSGLRNVRSANCWHYENVRSQKCLQCKNVCSRLSLPVEEDSSGMKNVRTIKMFAVQIVRSVKCLQWATFDCKGK